MVSLKKEEEKRKYKILYVGNFNPNSVGEPEIAWALEQIGHEVDKLEESRTNLNTIRTSLSRKDYDFLFFAKFRVGHNQEVIDFLRKELKIPSVCWLFDLYWGYRREKEIKVNMLPAFYADISFTTDGGHEEMWKKYNINHFLLRQGTDDRIKMGKPIYETEAELGFIGSRHTWAGWDYRGRLIDTLSRIYGNKFGHFGENGKVRHENLNNLLRTLKITICDTVESPYYWSNRIYETIGRGGFAIHPRIKGLNKEFEEFKHFIPYDYGNFRDLKNKIDFYLENDEARERIRNEGFKYCHKKHSYTNRARDLINKLEEQKII